MNWGNCPRPNLLNRESDQIRVITHVINSDPSPASFFLSVSYSHPLRTYQRLALEAFECGRAAGAARTYLVLPPGAGKTVLGLEIARRVGRQTLILCPNTAVQAQWLRQWEDFHPQVVASGAERDLSTPI